MLIEEYKGYCIESKPYKSLSGSYIVSGNVWLNNKRLKSRFKIVSIGKGYMTEKEADVAAMQIARHHINKSKFRTIWDHHWFFKNFGGYYSFSTVFIYLIVFSVLSFYPTIKSWINLH